METLIPVETRLRRHDLPQNQRDKKLKRLWKGVKFRLIPQRRKKSQRNNKNLVNTNTNESSKFSVGKPWALLDGFGGSGAKSMGVAQH